MKKLLALILVVAILGGAVFGILEFEKRRLAGQWLGYVDCTEEFTLSYVNIIKQYADLIRLGDYDFDGFYQLLLAEVPASRVPVTLSFGKDGRFTASVSQEELIAAADTAIKNCDAAAGHLLFDVLGGNSDKTSFLFGLVDGLFNTDLGEASEGAVVSLLQTTFSDSIDRSWFAAPLRPKLDSAGSYKAFLGMLRYDNGDTIKHIIKYKAEKSSLVLTASEKERGYLAAFSGQALSRSSDAVA